MVKDQMFPPMLVPLFTQHIIESNSHQNKARKENRHID